MRQAGTDDRRHQWDEDGGSYLEQHSHAQHQPGRCLKLHQPIPYVQTFDDSGRHKQ